MRFERRLLSLAGMCAAVVLGAPGAWCDVASYRAAVAATPGIVDYYSFEGDYVDQVDGGNGSNDGQSGGATPPVFVEGLNTEGQALGFDGSERLVEVSRSIQDDFTILAWINTAVSGAGDDASDFWQGSPVVYADVAGADNDFGTTVTGNVFAFGAGPGPGGGGDTTIHSTTVVTGGEWSQVAAVRVADAGAGTGFLRVYVNGELEQEIEHANTAPLDAAPSIYFGGNTIDGRYFTGSLDEIALFDAALDDAAIRGLYESAGDSSPTGDKFTRGDSNDDGRINVADAVFILVYIFRSGTAPGCLDTADTNDDGALNIADAVSILDHLFLNRQPLPAPYPGCGNDPTGDKYTECTFQNCP
jgi:hypothetical protein